MDELVLFLNDAVDKHDSGNIEEFVKQAQQIYNSCACFPSHLNSIGHEYLYGKVFAYFAPFVTNDINIYTTVLENAYFCLSKTIVNSESISEEQCAAIRLLLLIDDNNRVIMHIISRFLEERVGNICKNPMNTLILNEIMDKAFEKEILRMIGGYLIEKVGSHEKNSFISVKEMDKYNDILRRNCYSTQISLIPSSAEKIFMETYNFIYSVIQTPYDRRIKPIRW